MSKQDKTDIQQVIQRIKSLKQMRELEVREFALEGGLADQVVQALRPSELKPTQLRKVFHTLKGIQKNVIKEQQSKDKKDQKFDNSQLLPLMPVLAYSVGRELIPREFYNLLKEVFSPQRLETNEDFLRAFDFVEAILAYHKYRS
ncbi:MAG: type III-A CRISPR-associated protein Csm2 [Armatimonadota bacterium]